MEFTVDDNDDQPVVPVPPGLDATLREAVEYTISLAENGGGDCPCCQQRVQVYKRTLASSSAYGLITMYRHHGREFGHAPSTADLARLGGELARLGMRGLLEEKPELRDDGGRAGWWRVSELGESFVLGRCRVPKHIYVYAGQQIDYPNGSIETTSIEEACGKRFNYREMMSGLPPR
jgi:hypothetical protein